MSSRTIDTRSVALPLGWATGRLMVDRFRLPELAVKIKPDGTPVTEIDMVISAHIVKTFEDIDYPVLTEEIDCRRRYGKRSIYADPTDGTEQLLDAHRNSGPSIAAISIADVRGGVRLKSVWGLVNMPLLAGGPRLYWAAEAGRGVLRFTHEGSPPVLVRSNPEPETGIVLVSDSQGSRTSRLIQKLSNKGFTPIQAPGAVFKACCVIDPTLLQHAYPDLNPRGLPVVALVSEGALPHDYAGTAAMVGEGLALGLDGGELDFTAERRGCVFANNRAVMNQLIGAINSK